MSEDPDAASGTVVAHLCDLESRVGTELGRSGWHRITQEMVDRFAAITGDHQWIHVDPARAARGPYGRTVAHGYLTLSMAATLGQEAYRVADAVMGINYGSERVRFPAPVLVGSRVRAVVELIGYTPTERGARLLNRFTIHSDEGDRPVCVAEIISLIEAAGGQDRPSSAPPPSALSF